MQTVNLERADKKRSRDYQNINEDTLQCREKCHNKFTEFVLFFFFFNICDCSNSFNFPND